MAIWKQTGPKIPAAIIPGLPPAPKGTTPEERAELERLEQDHREAIIQKRLEIFKTLTPKAREEILHNEEILDFYRKMADSYVPVSARLEQLWNRPDVRPGGPYMHMPYPREYVQTLPPTMHVPLDRLRRAHLDACAESMITPE